MIEPSFSRDVTKRPTCFVHSFPYHDFL